MDTAEERYRQLWGDVGAPGAVLVVSDQIGDQGRAIIAGKCCDDAAPVIGIDPVAGLQGPVIDLVGHDIDRAIACMVQAGIRVLYAYRTG